MNRKLSIRPDKNNERAGSTQTWEIEGRVNLFLSDFDPVHNVNLRGHDVFCMYTENISPPYSLRVPIQVLTNVNDFTILLKKVDKVTENKCKKSNSVNRI